jgi:hypothetical protein
VRTHACNGQAKRHKSICAALLHHPFVPSPATTAAPFCVRASTGRNAAPV